MVLVVEPDSAPLEEFSSEYRIRALVFGGLREMLRAYGAELAPILAQARLSPEALKDDFNWIPLDKFALTLALAARTTGDPCFGLKYGASGRFANNPAQLSHGERAPISERRSNPSSAINVCSTPTRLPSWRTQAQARSSGLMQ